MISIDEITSSSGPLGARSVDRGHNAGNNTIVGIGCIHVLRGLQFKDIDCGARVVLRGVGLHNDIFVGQSYMLLIYELTYDGATIGARIVARGYNLYNDHDAGQGFISVLISFGQTGTTFGARVVLRGANLYDATYPGAGYMYTNSGLTAGTANFGARVVIRSQQLITGEAVGAHFLSVDAANSGQHANIGARLFTKNPGPFSIRGKQSVDAVCDLSPAITSSCQGFELVQQIKITQIQEFLNRTWLERFIHFHLRAELDQFFDLRHNLDPVKLNGTNALLFHFIPVSLRVLQSLFFHGFLPRGGDWSPVTTMRTGQE